jgi:peptidoglycan/xylan/chitin deacetylase (PgdA/CDA1 family)
MALFRRGRAATLVVLAVGLVAGLGAVATPASAADPPKTIVSITFDDGTTTQAGAAARLVDHGMRGTFYLNSAYLGDPGYLTVAQAQGLKTAGHELGSHTATHEDLGTQTDPAAVQDALCADRASLEGMGLGPVTSFAYPYAHVAFAAQVQACGYTSARNVGYLWGTEPPYRAERIPPEDRYALDTVDAAGTPATGEPVLTLEQLKAAVEAAEAEAADRNEAGWLIFLFHTICEGPCTDPYGFGSADYGLFLDYLAAERASGQLVVQTVGQVTAGLPSAPVVAGPASLSSGTVGHPYAAQITGSGGTVPYTWSATGLPAGLSIDAASGVVSGTPIASGTTTVTVGLTDGHGATATRSYELTIDAALAITGPASLPDGTVGTAYPATTVSRTAGVAPFTWSATGLPAGLSIGATTGVVSGSPSAAGSAPVTVTVTDALGASASRNYTLAVHAAAPAITGPASLPAGILAEHYPATTLSVTGGTAPVTWSAVGLPPGLSIDAGTGTIAGTPSEAGHSAVMVTATDAAGRSATRAYPLDIAGGKTAPHTAAGYWMVTSDGKVFAFGAAAHFGDPQATIRARQASGVSAVDIEPTATHQGYWVVDDVGTVYAFGDARADLGGAGLTAGQLAAGERVTSLSATPSGAGYWLFTNRGRVVNRGDAGHFGDMAAVSLNGPVLDSIPTTSGLGYYMVASDGGIFAFGDAAFHGSMGGQALNAPVQSLVPTATGGGYWLVASDGGIFAFGDAAFHGSMGGQALNRPVTGMVRYGNGYLMVGEDGGIFNFSDQDFVGSLGANPPDRPVVSVAAPA